MRVALVNTPVWDAGEPPLGIAYLAAMAREAGFEARVFDYNVTVWNLLQGVDVDGGVNCFDDENSRYFWNRDLFREHVLPHLRSSIDALVDELCACKPDVIGFCVRYTSFPCTRALAEACRARLPSARIIIGGPEASPANVKSIIHEIRDTPIEAVVLGEGEATLLEILRAWQEGRGLDGCKGVLHRLSSGEFVQEEMRELLPLTALPRPEFDGFDLSRYSRPGSLLVSLSRGCIAKCTFCSETRFWIRYRFRAAEDVHGEIRSHVERLGIRHVFFGDSLVNGNFKVLSELVDRFRADPVRVEWGGFCRVDERLSAEFLQRMFDAGCRFLMFGFETGSQKVADLMSKNAKVETAKRVFRDARAAGIKAMVCVIAGFPGEEEEDFEETLSFLRENGEHIEEIYTNKMNLMLGTPVRENPERFGVSTKEMTVDGWETADGRNTPAVREARLARLREVVDEHRRRKEARGARGLVFEASPGL